LPGDILEYPQVILEKQTLDVFNNPQASALVERIGSDAEYVVFGVVTELCVRCAATGLLNRGRKISVVEDAIEAIDTEQARRTLEELQARGAQRITTDEALDKIEAVSRRAAVRESARP
jgi:nicotinamidase/pyrazinamidase